MACTARELNIAVADEVVSVPQTNGVRQGSPDSQCSLAESSPTIFRRHSVMPNPSWGTTGDHPPPFWGGIYG